MLFLYCKVAHFQLWNYSLKIHWKWQSMCQTLFCFSYFSLWLWKWFYNIIECDISFLSHFRFQVDPNSPYAKPMKSSITPDAAGKKGQLTKDIQQIQESVSCTDFRPPDDKMDDQQLSEEQMAWRYASKGLHLISLPSCWSLSFFTHKLCSFTSLIIVFWNSQIAFSDADD